MASTNISQLRRLVLRKRNADNTAWETLNIEADSLGGDNILSLNIAPKKMERSSSIGTTTTPISGTMDSFSASITFLADTWAVLGQVIGRWNKATYQGATNASGNMTDGGDNLCGDGKYWSVIAQGLCDDGSTTDVELSRCIPSMDDEISVSANNQTEVSINLNPQIYNATVHAGDGYPEYSYRLGDHSLTTKERLNATTGEYEAV